MSNAGADERRGNPVVDRYVTTDVPIGVLIQAVPAPRAPILDAILAVHDCLDGRLLARDAIGRASSVDIHGADHELVVLFFAAWAELSCRIARPSEAATLIHRGRALVGGATHPEVRAALDYSEGVLADTTGNKAGAEKILLGILEYVSPHSPRRKYYAWELAMFLALQGRAAECEDSLKELAWRCNERFPLAKVALARFLDAVETGRARDAAHLMTDIAAAPQVMRDLRRARYRGYQYILKLMHSQQGSIPQPGATDPAWTGVAHALLIPDPRLALELARAEAGRTLGSLFESGFAAYNLIRAEMANGAWEGAKRLLAMRASRGNTHYLDDLFLARAELLAGNRQQARRHFARLLDSAARYNARGRLDFELRLSSELGHGDVVLLSQPAPERGPERRDPAPRPAPAPAGRERAPVSALDAIIGKSGVVRALKENIARFAPLDAPVLVTGETGTGKELAARALHEESPRCREPFIAVNCGSITDTLLESELFGHERGAFTGADKANKGIFEEAGKGTVFLDEIGSISPRLQGSLLRVLETGEARAVGSPRARTVQCRIVAATNVPLETLVSGGQFRSDLFFRLKRLEVSVPTLRERREDIPLLVRHFLDAGRPLGQHAAMARQLESRFIEYEWPGNVRELRNVVERMRLLHSDKMLYDLPDVDIKLLHTAPAPAPAAPEPAGAPPAAPAPAPANRASPAASFQATDRDVGAVLAESRSAVRRVERLKELFEQHSKLTRSEIIRITGVSPNTATKDLKALCDEGFVRRVEPSSSSRSYYFERVG